MTLAEAIGQAYQIADDYLDCEIHDFEMVMAQMKRAGDCLGPFYHEISLAKRPLVIQGPFTTLNSAPGLGIEIDWDVVARHRIR
jgi:L-alanine-DL-glutamate epimerase-like enolase superfamily enzyme